MQRLDNTVGIFARWFDEPASSTEDAIEDPVYGDGCINVISKLAIGDALGDDVFPQMQRLAAKLGDGGEGLELLERSAVVAKDDRPVWVDSGRTH